MITSGGYKLILVRSGYTDTTQAAKPLIEDLPCDAVRLSVWNTVDDTQDTPIDQDTDASYAEANAQIYYGCDNICVHQVFPQQTTDLIGCNNAREISVRCSAAKTDGPQRVFWSAYRYVPIREVNQ
jgi:hypothetical protein